MITEKTKPVEEGEISFEELANSSFSFEVDNFIPEKKDGIIVTLDEPTEEEKAAAAKAEEEAAEAKKKEDEADEGLSEEEKAAKAKADEEAEAAAKEAEEAEAKKKSTPSDSAFKKLASRYLEEGTWEDVEVDIDGTSVKLSEIEDLDEDTFFEIQSAQKEFANEDLTKKFVSKEGIDENGLKLIEILKNGGDIREIFENPQDAIRPFENVDLDNERIQESILFQQYRLQGLSETESTNLVGMAKKNLTMDDKVSQIVNFHQKKYDTFLDETLEAQKKARIEEQAKLKEFKKGVMDNLRENFKLKDTLARKLSSLGADKNESGEFKIDEIYAKKMEDPKEAADLLFFLSDKEAYLKMMGAKTKRDTNLNTIRKVSILKDKKKTTKNEADTPKSDLEFSVPVGK